MYHDCQSGYAPQRVKREHPRLNLPVRPVFKTGRHLALSTMVNGNLALQRAPGMDTPGYIRYFGAAAWGICIMVSMVGWGAVMRRVTAPAQKSPGDWGQLACIGFSLTTVVGGILNFFALISRLSVISYVVLGVVAFSYSPSRDLIRFPAPGGDGRFSAYPWFAKALLLLAGLLLCVRFFGAVVTTEAPNTVYPAINPYDDLQGYLVFPEKMIQTGAMGVDPFSLRRTPTHTLGGSPFLKSLIVAAFPEENVPLLDAGLGPVLVVGVLLGYLAQMAASPLATGIVLLTFLLIPAPTWNTTPMVIPMALILSLFRIQTEAFTAQNRLSGPVLIGLHVAALASLKSSLIPAAVALAAVNYLLISATAGNRGEAIRRAAVACLSCGLFLSPWIADMYRMTGSLFPVSLAIYHANPEFVRTLKELTDWRLFFSHIRVFPPIPFLVIAVLLAITGAGRGRPKMERLATVSLVAAVLLDVAGVVVGMGGFNLIYRYVLAVVVAGALVVVAQFVVGAERRRSSGEPVLKAVLIGGLAVGVFLGANARQVKDIYAGCIRAAARGLRGDKLVSQDIAERQSRLQMSIPPGVTVLTRLRVPFLLDFRRNRVFIIDFPGGAGLAPGMPFFTGSESLAEYLTSRGIRYFAFDYADLSAMVPARPTRMSPFATTVFLLTSDLYQNLQELSRTRRRIYQDGSALVLDLQQR